jgi:uncharacterized protein YbaP (TraB family)
MHRRTRALPLSLALIAALACASTRPQPADPPFWRADGADGATLYLLGSVHFGWEGGWAFPRVLDEAFERAEVLVVEIDDRDLDPVAMRHLMRDRGVLSEGESLESILAPELWTLLSERMAALGLPAALVEHVEPWAAAMAVMNFDMESRGLRGEQGVDHQLLARAGSEKEVRPLESVELQIALMDELAPELQELMLKETLITMEEKPGQIDAVMEAWSRGDEEELEKLILGPMASKPELRPLYRAFTLERNRMMADSLEQWLNSGRSVFAVVGAGHLLGEEGIVSLLRARGHRVRRVRRP